MTPGPTLIMKAPGCKKLVKFSTIASGNEVMRELSRYDEALSHLAFEYPEDSSHAVTRIRELATAKNAQVARLTQ